MMSSFGSNRSEFVAQGYQSLVEAIIQYDESIGITNYKPTNSVNHKYLTHGQGVKNGSVVSICCMFDGIDFLTDKNSSITEFFAQSCYLDGFDYPNTKEKMFVVFADGIDFHENTKKNFVDSERTQLFNLNEIKSRIDGNVDFWESYKESLENVAIEPSKGPFIPDADQKEAIEALCSKENGRYQIIWPTGTGKNEIMMEHSVHVVQKTLTTNPRPRILFERLSSVHIFEKSI
jgi:hypothetical protein